MSNTMKTLAIAGAPRQGSREDFGRDLLSLARSGCAAEALAKAPDAMILDQRALWVFLLLVPMVKGAGALSVDRLLVKNAPLAHPVSRQQAPKNHQAP